MITILNNSLVLKQQQTVSASQILSLEILSYTNQELKNFLTTEYLENPMLENTQDKQDDMIKDLEQMYEKGVSYKDHYIEWEEEDCNRRNDIPVDFVDEINEFLISQLHEGDYNKEEWSLIRYLIQCLDEDGFFTHETIDIARAFGYSESTVYQCLEMLKTLEPVGIFSKNISECLKRQLKSQGIDDVKLYRIVENYMSDILEGHIGIVSRNLNLSTAKVKEYIHLIGSLNPRPIMSIQAYKTEYIIPDILVTSDKCIWEISINDSWMGEYKFNEYYIRMMNESKDSELTIYFKKKLERARFVINCVEQRRCTIIKVVEAILETQEDFFRFNKELKPMSMESIASKTGIHVSTVSRAIKDKYLQYKKTVFLKDLFTASSSSSQGDVSANTVKVRIKEIIELENVQKPLSDLKIAELMKEEGIDISRRTITKYRKQLGIPESRQRLYL